MTASTPPETASTCLLSQVTQLMFHKPSVSQLGIFPACMSSKKTHISQPKRKARKSLVWSEQRPVQSSVLFLQRPIKRLPGAEREWEREEYPGQGQRQLEPGTGADAYTSPGRKLRGRGANQFPDTRLLRILPCSKSAISKPACERAPLRGERR